MGFFRNPTKYLFKAVFIVEFFDEQGDKFYDNLLNDFNSILKVNLSIKNPFYIF